MNCLLFDLNNTLLEWPQDLTRIKPRAELLEFLRELDVPTAIVTAGTRRNQLRKYRAAGLDEVIPPQNLFFCPVGRAKTQPILAALKRLGFSSRETLFVGDDPEYDIRSAHQAGCRTAWLSCGRSFPPGYPEPTFTLNSLFELGALLGERFEL